MHTITEHLNLNFSDVIATFIFSSHWVKSPLTFLLHSLAVLPAQHLKIVINLHALQNARESKNFPLMPSSDSVDLFLVGTARGNVFQTEGMHHNQLELFLLFAGVHLV